MFPLVQQHTFLIVGDSADTIGAAAGSLFVFKGKYKAVLINYPNREEKYAILAEARKNQEKE